MKGFFKFVLIFAVILLLSAVLAPFFYVWLPKFLGLFGFDKIYKFERVFQRIVMIGTLVAAVLFVRIRKETLVRFGLLWNTRSLGLFKTGFFTGLVLLGSVGALRVYAGQAVFAPDSFPWVVWGGKILAALATGLLIGIMEEFFFRGFVFRSLLKTFGNRVFLSILVTTVFYSLIHFIGIKKIFVDQTPSVVDSFRLMTAPFLSLAAWPKFWPQAVGLFFFGWALNTAAYRSGSLYASIGLHAGCVFFVRLDDIFMKQHQKWSLFWGSKILYDGILGWGFLILMTALVWILLKPSASEAPKGNV
ncbi:MAG TPA: CPBP family intramembrane metalloprotease [Candidatus Omnitrophota bacterium]|nr:CPBP family intramembrane metalloprotease [Candidatus Omnitrophota bacterium]HPS37631.1 CPBP family intramembrane metalloprotease [Candidatus Omnitrophota bacterium]